MKMYEQIEQIIVRTLSPFEYEILEDLKKQYTEKQIIGAYKLYGDKPINYITKVIKNIKKAPDWLDKEIKAIPPDEKTIKCFEDFNEILKGFRNDKNN